MKKFVYTLIIFFVAAVFSCKGPGDLPGEGDDTPDTVPAVATAPDAPTGVTVSVGSNGVATVTWNPAFGAELYELFRKVDEGGYVSTGSTSSSSYSDSTMPLDAAVQYAVKSTGRAGIQSGMSIPSNTVSYYIQDVLVGKLESVSGIDLIWAPIDEPEFQSYVIYRYSSVLDGDLEREVEQVSNVFKDTTVSANTPYFYRIVWKKNGEVIGGDAPKVFGVFSNSVDRYEPNEDYMQVKGSYTSQFTGWGDTNAWEDTPFIYSFSDGNGGSVYDTDWYVYRGVPTGAVTVSVELPAGTDFSSVDCKLILEFYYNGSYYAAEDIPSNFVKDFVFSDFDEYGGAEQQLYFRISPVVSTSMMVSGKYKVNITDGI